MLHFKLILSPFTKMLILQVYELKADSIFEDFHKSQGS